MITGEARPSPPSPPGKKNKKGKKRRRPSKKDDGMEASKSTRTTTNEIGPTTDGNNGEVLASVAATREERTTAIRNNGGRVGFGNFPYPTDYNDHFETPARAYDDIFPLMEYIFAKRAGRRDDNGKIITTKSNVVPPNSGHGRSTGDETVIYDPYYCSGRAGSLLGDVFRRNNMASKRIRIQHEKRDFYRDIKMDAVPRYDILVTNPPYSGDHKERCLDFAVGHLRRYGRPFFLLMPNYVAMKEYFRRTVLEGGTNPTGSGGEGVQTFYISPSPGNPYEYDHPDGTGHQVSPFDSVWFCGLSYGGGGVVTAQKNQSVIDAYDMFHSIRHPSSRGGGCSTKPRIVSSLRELISAGGVSGERRKNPRQRRRMRLLRAALPGSDRDAMAVGDGAGDGAGDTLDARPMSNKKRKLGISIRGGDNIERRRGGGGMIPRRRASSEK